MALSDEFYRYMEEVFEAFHDQRDSKRLSDWDKTFMADQEKRFIEYEHSFRFTQPQWKHFSRICDKLGKSVDGHPHEGLE